MRIENVQVLMPTGVFREGAVEFGETIQKVEEEQRGTPRVPEETAGQSCAASPRARDEDEGIGSTAGKYLIPGLIDLHTHGALGGDHTDGNSEKLREMAVFYAENGTTSFLATTLTDTFDALSGAMRCVAGHERPTGGARCLGVNLEGPFFSHEKRGAHRADLLRLPDIPMFESLNKQSGWRIKLACVSPELDGATQFIKAVSQVCHVSLAHSASDYKTAMEGFSSGATHVTHLFNGMNPFYHREPGIIGAALESGAFVELICDGYHLHQAVVQAVFAMFPQRVCLISDSLRCTGLPDGEYMSAGLPVTVTGGKAVLMDGGGLAGSTITLLQGVRKAVAMGIPLAQAATAASANCARAIGMEGTIGALLPGAYADMLLLDAELNIQKVYIGGVEVSAEAENPTSFAR